MTVNKWLAAILISLAVLLIAVPTIIWFLPQGNPDFTADTPKGGFTSDENLGNTTVLTFSDFSDHAVISLFKVVVQRTMPDNSQLSQSWCAFSNANGTRLVRSATESVTLPEIWAITYHDLKEDQYLEDGDDIVISFSDQATARGQYRVVLVFLPTGEIVANRALPPD